MLIFPQPVATTPGPTVASLPADLTAITANTTLQDITGLGVAIGASATEIWLVKYWLLVNFANATMDIKLGLTGPAGATARWGGNVGGSANISGFGALDVASTPVRPRVFGESLALASLAGIGGIAAVAIVVGGGTAGNVQLQYAQNTSDAGALQVLKSSLVEATKIAA